MSDDLPSLQQNAARNLVTKYLQVKPGESVIVESWDHTRPMSAAIVDEVRRAGAQPLLLHEDEKAFWSAVDRKQGKQLGKLSRSEWAALKAADVYVMFWGPGDSERLESLPEKTEEEVFAWNDQWYKVARQAGLRGVRMGLGFATDSRASHWGTTTEELTRELLQAGLADPRTMAKEGERLQRSLQPGRKVRIVHDNGTDVEVALARTPSRMYVGLRERQPKDDRFGMLVNHPEGRLLTALDGATAEGTIVANRPTYAPWGTAFGGKFEFHDGRLASFSFGKGEELVRKRYEKAKGAKDRTGSLYLGLNPNVVNVPNLEDMERGIVCLTVGNNANSGGKNRSDFMGWVSLAGAEISVDGTPIIRAGRIL